MSTKSTILLQGNLHIYLELLDMTVHAETDNSPAFVSVVTGGTQADMELMTMDQWRALGFPISFPPRAEDETVVNPKSQLAEAHVEIANLRAALEILATPERYDDDGWIKSPVGTMYPHSFARRALGVEATTP